MPASYELYLVRHGVAEERSEAWPDDGKRPLTDQGMSRVRRSSRALARLGVPIDLVLTSPLVRTRQTAELLAAGFSPRPPVVNADGLLPGTTPPAMAAEIEKHGRRPRIAIVGHEPGIGEFAAWLIGARSPIAFKKGAICRIDVDAGTMRGVGMLRWFLTPKILKALKK